VSEPDGDWYLDVDYLDTVAAVFINGSPALVADNSFRRYRPDVGNQLKAGDNVIRIILHSSIAAGADRQDKQPFYIPYSTGNSPIPNGNMLRKPQCHFGWDWNIAIAPLGLYGTIALRKLETARIEHVTTRQVHNADGSVDLQVRRRCFPRTRASCRCISRSMASACGSMSASARARPWSIMCSRSTSRASGGHPAAASRRSMR
jgi:beta-mannosidase